MGELKKWQDWDVVRIIGRGSFGVVYEIEREIFGEIEKAALKVISIPQNESDINMLRNEGYDDESITMVFNDQLQGVLREYMLMRKLNGNTNVVNCDDVQRVQREDNMGWDIFIKMELLKPMAEMLPRVVSDGDVVKVGLDICNALNLCNRFNIIHRDIKPQNIFISPHGDYKLGDFGVARTMERTAGGTKIGTYNYMPPEVYNNQDYNQSVDIYSLGLVLYWLLNERRTPFLPLPPAVATASDQESARYRRFRGEELPPPKHGCKELQAVVLKACAFDPKERYQSAVEMERDLKMVPVESGDSTIGVWGLKPGGTTTTTSMEPSVKEPSVKEPSVKEPSVKEPSVKEPSVKEPSVKEPSVKEPSVKEPSVKEPDVKEPKTGKSGKSKIIIGIAVIVVALLLTGIGAFMMGGKLFGSKELFSYEDLSDGTVVILEMNDKSRAVADVPAEINGKVVTQIGPRAFSGCEFLQQVTLPDTITVIGEGAFEVCVSLEEIQLPNSVTTIGDYAFSGCSSLKSMILSDSVTKIGHSVFFGCSSMTKVKLPESMTEIPNNMFYSCTSLAEISIPKAVTTIGEGAFIGCSALTKLVIPASVKTIGNSAFAWCSSLKEVTIPDSVASIGEHAFAACTGMSKITIPTTVETIAYGAISDNNGLKHIYYKGDKTAWNELYPTYGEERKGGYIKATMHYKSK